MPSRERSSGDAAVRAGTGGAGGPGGGLGAGGPGGRQGAGGAERVPDDLWPPFGPQSSSDRDSRAHRRLHEYAERDRGRDQRGRGRNRQVPSLSRGEIVDAAIAVADAEGPDAISMRRIAQVLRAGTMSLYWHVANKEHLLDLMLDSIIAEAGVPEPTGDWRADLQALARGRRAMLLRHLWVMDFVGGRPPLGPNTLLNLEGSLAMLDGIGLEPGTVFAILEMVQTYVMGAVLRELRERRSQRDQEQSGISEEDRAPAWAAWRERLDADGRFSHLVRFLDEDIDPDAAETRDQRFEFGLDCVLDGIAMKIAKLSGGTAP
jgi:AcrR family transcriptional regulator